MHLTFLHLGSKELMRIYKSCSYSILVIKILTNYLRSFTMDSLSFKATQPLFSAFFSCLAIMLSAISASGVERVHGSAQTGKDYSNTTVNSQ